MTAEPPSFDEVTSVHAAGEGGRFTAELDLAWHGTVAPHGGVLSAMLLRAMDAQVAHTGFSPQAFDAHFLRPPQPGRVEITATLERAGRRIATATATLHQEGRLFIRASASFASFGGVVAPEWAPPLPQMPAAADTPRGPDVPELPPVIRRLDWRPALGPRVFSGASEALTGGWIQCDPPHLIDGPLVVFLADAWLPPSFTRVTEPIGVPTLDLTVHFVRPLREPLAADPVAVRFTGPAACAGIFIEDGELWASDGGLLAVSRQSALLVPDY